VKSTVNGFIGRTVTNLQLICHVIDSHSYFVGSQRAELFHVPFGCHCGQAPWLFFVSGTCTAPSNMSDQFTHRRFAMSPYSTDSLRWVSAPLTPSTHKNLISARCSSLVQTVGGTAKLTPVTKASVKSRRVRACCGRIQWCHQ